MGIATTLLQNIEQVPEAIPTSSRSLCSSRPHSCSSREAKVSPSRRWFSGSLLSRSEELSFGLRSQSGLLS